MCGCGCGWKKGSSVTHQSYTAGIAYLSVALKRRDSRVLRLDRARSSEQLPKPTTQ